MQKDADVEETGFEEETDDEELESDPYHEACSDGVKPLTWLRGNANELPTFTRWNCAARELRILGRTRPAKAALGACTRSRERMLLSRLKPNVEKDAHVISVLGKEFEDSLTKDYCRIAEYFEKSRQNMDRLSYLEKDHTIIAADPVLAELADSGQEIVALAPAERLQKAGRRISMLRCFRPPGECNGLLHPKTMQCHVDEHQGDVLGSKVAAGSNMQSVESPTTGARANSTPVGSGLAAARHATLNGTTKQRKHVKDCGIAKQQKRVKDTSQSKLSSHANILSVRSRKQEGERPR